MSAYKGITQALYGNCIDFLKISKHIALLGNPYESHLKVDSQTYPSKQATVYLAQCVALVTLILFIWKAPALDIDIAIVIACLASYTFITYLTSFGFTKDVKIDEERIKNWEGLSGTIFYFGYACFSLAIAGSLARLLDAFKVNEHHTILYAGYSIIVLSFYGFVFPQLIASLFWTRIILRLSFTRLIFCLGVSFMIWATLLNLFASNFNLKNHEWVIFSIILSTWLICITHFIFHKLKFWRSSR